MSGRPEVLFPLFAKLETLPGVGPRIAASMQAMGVEKPRDLLFSLPYSGIDRSRRDSAGDAPLPCVVTTTVTVGAHRPPARKGGPYRVHCEDAGGPLVLVFFHARGTYLEGLLPPGARRVVSGKAERFDGIVQMVHPDHIVTEDEAAQIPEFEPVYHLGAGVTAKQMAKAAAGAAALAPELEEWIDPLQLEREGWPAWHDAVAAAHAPSSLADLSPAHPARARLAYDEFMAHQLTLALARQARRRKPGIRSEATGALQSKVLRALPYQPTGAQERAMGQIAADLAAPHRMNRLLQGDVGAGKTLVAFMALLTVVEAGGQGVMMAPTSILAQQHMQALAPLAEDAGVVLEILTGRDKGAGRAAKLAALAEGRIHILVGTHAVFQQDVTFHDLRLAVIDEQHRFGVNQRALLGEKGAAVDVLVMTATPIPRSLALASHGDMDVSVLDEKPPGRKPVRTALISSERLGEVTDHLAKAVAEGRQAYWVCPLVDESELSSMTAAEERFKHLRARLGEGRVGLVHGQMPPEEKDAAMADFAAGRTQVLVATTVIEVGVNVPNATIMVIEQAESFGLAQLHQLRGRVGRGEGESTCLLLYSAPLGESAERRLTTMRETEDGFRIAEVDMELRGAGDLIGTAQSGLPRFRIADLERQGALMQIAQTDARRLLESDPRLESPRGQAARVLLWLMEQDKAIRLISIG